MFPNEPYDAYDLEMFLQEVEEAPPYEPTVEELVELLQG